MPLSGPTRVMHFKNPENLCTQHIAKYSREREKLTNGSRRHVALGDEGATSSGRLGFDMVVIAIASWRLLCNPLPRMGEQEGAPP